MKGGGRGVSYPFQPQSTAEVATKHEDSSMLNYAEEHTCKELHAGVDRQVDTICGVTKHSLT